MSWKSSLRPQMHLLESRLVPAVWLVDDTPGTDVDFATIQDAVDAAAAGDTILVAPGTYEEQVTLGPDKDNLILRSVSPQQAVIQAPESLEIPAALVYVNGAEDVVIRGFTITGPSDELDIGILVDMDGSATIQANRITDIGPDTLSGVQTGIAVWMDSGAEAVVRDNTLTGYQKGGIVAVEEGTRLIATGNTITGAGATDQIAQNGIQVAVGAEAILTRNRIGGHQYTGSDSAEATGVIVHQAGRVTVSGNTIAGNDIGVLAELQSAQLSLASNTIAGSILDGIQLDGVDGAVIGGNLVTDSGRDGIRLEDVTGSLLVFNVVTDSGENGIAVSGDSEGNVIFLNRARGSGSFDALDETTGDGTADTANFWRFNSFGTRKPGGLR